MRKIIMKIKHFIQLILYNFKESKDFINDTEYNSTEERQDYILAVAAHTLEKGLGCITYKEKWGEEKAIRLLNLMSSYIDRGYDQSRFGFSDAFAVLKSYIQHKKERGENINSIEDMYKKICSKKADNIQMCLAGKEIVNRENLDAFDSQAALNLLTVCRSVRNYAPMAVLENDIKEAVQNALRAPSACNRQPVKCYYTMDQHKIKMCDSLIPGNSAIKDKTPNFIIVTTSRQYFGLYEYNQWYVNGGIFLGYLRLSLHAKGIGNCLYQWPINAEEKQLRSLYAIPETEKIIGIVGIGYFPERAHCIVAQRRAVEEVLIRR